MSYGKNKLDCFYHIGKFEKHEILKENVLSAMESALFQSPSADICEVNISKTDWFLSTDLSREWVKILSPSIMDYSYNTYSQFGYNAIEIHEMWFQQYMKNSEHGWHTHGCNFTNVYYLELPDDAPKTTLVDPFTQKTIININIQEGDILSFPSFVLHKTAKNLSNEKKTIVSWNLNVGYPDNKYEEISNSFISNK